MIEQNPGACRTARGAPARAGAARPRPPAPPRAPPPAPRGAARRGAAALAPQDMEHAKALASHLEALGMPVPGPTRGRDDLAPEALAVLQTTGDRERRREAMEYERSLIAGCLQRLPRLEEPNT